MFSEIETCTAYYPYSDELKKLLEYGASIKIHPIYVIGLSQSDLHALRNAYANPESKIRVGIYGIYDINVLPNRLGIEPTVVVLAEHIALEGVIAEFVKRNRTPVLRLQDQPRHLHDLCHEDYYGGVYETMDAKHIRNTEEVTYMLNLGILVWLRNHGEQQRRKAELDLSGAEKKTVNPKATTSVKKLPKPESSWEAFASKQMKGFVPTPRFEDSVRKLDAELNYKNVDSSFDLNLDS